MPVGSQQDSLKEAVFGLVLGSAAGADLELMNERLIEDLLATEGAADRVKEFARVPSYAFPRSSLELLQISESLREIRRGAASYPWRGRVTRSTHLRWLHELFCDQTYLAKERVKTWCNSAIELAGPNEDTLKSLASSTLNRFPATLSKLIALRGQRIHERDLSNPIVAQIALLELLSGDGGVVSKDLARTFIRIRRKEVLSGMDEAVTCWDDYLELLLTDWSPIWRRLMPHAEFTRSELVGEG